ncbi:MAG: hypothetical protein Q4D60_05645 [Eubacteriales bacterium]|nr:hypothetical protein [Eubacteriales bacterium]
MRPPDIARSTKEERYEYIKENFRCKNHCESCGLCKVYGGKEPLLVYEKYIEGEEDFFEITQRYR